MENFQNVKEALIKKAIKKNACKDQLERAKACDSWEELQQVIIDNIWWLHERKVKVPDGSYKSSRYQFTIVNGKPHGEYNQWFKNGQLWEHSNYENGVLHGEYKEWYENGQLAVHSHYENGFLHGECKRWYSNGQLAYKKNIQTAK